MGEVITHLQFANDTIMFNSTRREEVLALKRILQCFQLASGLKVNLSKGILVRIGCSEEITRSLADMVHCKLGRLPVVYPGLPIGAKARSKAWELVTEALRGDYALGRNIIYHWAVGSC